MVGDELKFQCEYDIIYVTIINAVNIHVHFKWRKLSKSTSNVIILFSFWVLTFFYYKLFKKKEKNFKLIFLKLSEVHT